MRTPLFALTAFILAAPLSTALADPMGSVNQLVVFGDSLSDTGNAYYLENAYKSLYGTLPPGEPYPVPPNYTTGSFTDGPTTTPSTNSPTGLWIDQFAHLANLSDPGPFLVNGGTNYATGAAEAGSNPAFPTGVPWTTNQVTEFTASHLTGAPSNALYTFWAGGDSIFAGQNPVTAADDIYGNIQTLHAEGANDFLWLNLPALGDTPVGAGNSATLNAATAAFNAEWQLDLTKLQSQGIDVIGVDVATLFDDILADPSAYGFTNTTGAAWCGTGALPNCASNNPNDFVFWDGEHPTTAADALVAQLAYDDFTGVNSAAVPEPMNFGLSLAGLCGLLAACRLRRKNALRA